MAKIKVGINGFGRVGRNVFKLLLKQPNIQLVGVNDLTDTRTLAHLLKYDSNQGMFVGDISYKENSLLVNGEKYKVTSSAQPADIAWETVPNVVVESTGIFRKKESSKGGYGDHLKQGVKKVVLTVPAKDEIDRMIVIGVNDDDLLPADKCVSNASCTTNCLAPIVKILNDNFGIENGYMTTVHSYTADQKIQDLPHKDLRRARAAALSQIPTTTGAAKSVEKVIPELDGRLDGIAVRVPTPTGSLVDFVVNLKKSASREEINEAVRKASQTYMKGIVQYIEDPVVSIDVVGNPHSAVFDSLATMSMGKTAKILAWYDNEWGYCARVADLINKMF